MSQRVAYDLSRLWDELREAEEVLASLAQTTVDGAVDAELRELLLDGNAGAARRVIEDRLHDMTAYIDGDRAISKPAIDALYEPLSADELDYLLALNRAGETWPRKDYPSAVKSSAANKIEAQLHLALTGQRIYERAR